MKAVAGLLLLAGLALAAPVDTDDVDTLGLGSYDEALPQPLPFIPVGDEAPEEESHFDPSKVAEAAVAQVTDAPAASAAPQDVVLVNKVKRVATCTTRTFNGPQVTTPADSAAAFQAYQPFADAAIDAAKAANVPEGYAVVRNYVNLKAAANNIHYLTYVSSKLNGYDVPQCAQICNDMAGCRSFTIFYTRVPLVVSSTTQVPDSQVCPATDSSASATLIKCAFYGDIIKAEEATNVGQLQGKFKVVFAGVNAYYKSDAPSVDGFEGPYSFGNAAINAPRPVIDHGYLRTQTFGTNVPFHPALCADSCNQQTAYNVPRGKPACVFFDAFVLYKNGINGVFTCAYYSTPYDSSFAKNTGQKDNSGNVWTIGSSYGYYAPGNNVMET